MYQKFKINSKIYQKFQINSEFIKSIRSITKFIKHFISILKSSKRLKPRIRKTYNKFKKKLKIYKSTTLKLIEFKIRISIKYYLSCTCIGLSQTLVTVNDIVFRPLFSSMSPLIGVNSPGITSRGASHTPS